jgi:hypothetical protein
MKNRDLPSSLVWIGVGVIFCIGGLKYGLFVKHVPGPGFLPFLAGICLVGLSTMLLLSSIFVKKNKTKPILQEAFFPEKDSWKRMLQVLCALLFYVIALERLGFLITTPPFMIATILILERKRWHIILPAVLLSTACFYLVFKVLLKVELPEGIFGI